MSITDELRKWVRDGKGSLLAIADRIDAEHESACAEAYGNGVMSVPIALDENAWVKLPKDADNVPIHAGDVLDGYGKTIEVVEMRHGRNGWVLISRDGNGYADTFAFTHHAPTVEDVLAEFAAKLIERGELTNGGAQTIAEYAKRLTLVEGEDA